MQRRQLGAADEAANHVRTRQRTLEGKWSKRLTWKDESRTRRPGMRSGHIGSAMEHREDFEEADEAV